jgi:Ca2+-binding EF-hand superfamily protein
LKSRKRILNREPVLDVEALKAIFDQFDINHDGKLSLKEIITCYRRFGQNPTEEEVTKRMARFRLLCPN